ncbi:MAG: flagellar hook-basal body complex protein FliE [Candidatus Hydrogenedentes bacterium]|nr:flagellar hook-basal body complex protein FliE [Candidatus Hydrogenedentota bacterium]
MTIDPLKIPGLNARPLEISARQMRAPQPHDAQPAGKSFKEMLADAITEVQQLQTEADTTIKRLVAGEIKDVSEAMVAVEKADVSFQTMMAVRGKVMTAYEEIMRMQI